MSKAKAKAKPAKTAKPAETAKPAGVVRVNRDPELKLPRATSARGQYYARLLQFDGKPLADFIASCEANTPSKPKNGKLANKPEPIGGWIGWFKREGFLTVSE
jgi:hypothetical protein